MRVSTAQSTTSGLSLCKLEAVDPALIKEHTDFSPAVPQTHIWFNGSLRTASALAQTCVEEYKAKLIELLVDSELQLNAQQSTKKNCGSSGIQIRFTQVQLSHSSYDKVSQTITKNMHFKYIENFTTKN